MKIDKARFVILAGKKGLTIKELAEKAGISSQTISATKARGTCSVGTLVNIARALGVEPETLLADDYSK